MPIPCKKIGGLENAWSRLTFWQIVAYPLNTLQRKGNPGPPRPPGARQTQRPPTTIAELVAPVEDQRRRLSVTSAGHTGTQKQHMHPMPGLRDRAVPTRAQVLKRLFAFHSRLWSQHEAPRSQQHPEPRQQAGPKPEPYCRREAAAIGLWEAGSVGDLMTHGMLNPRAATGGAGQTPDKAGSTPTAAFGGWAANCQTRSGPQHERPAQGAERAGTTPRWAQDKPRPGPTKQSRAARRGEPSEAKAGGTG